MAGTGAARQIGRHGAAQPIEQYKGTALQRTPKPPTTESSFSAGGTIVAVAAGLAFSRPTADDEEDINDGTPLLAARLGDASGSGYGAQPVPDEVGGAYAAQWL